MKSTKVEMNAPVVKESKITPLSVWFRSGSRRPIIESSMEIPFRTTVTVPHSKSSFLLFFGKFYHQLEQVDLASYWHFVW